MTAQPIPEGARQEQFLSVLTRDEATERFESALDLSPLQPETVSLSMALDRILAVDIISSIDVPGFDRSNVDGFAVQASDTFGATESDPKRIALNAEVLSPGVAPEKNVTAGSATTIATGGMLPRGADAVVMIEHTQVIESSAGHQLEIRRAVAPGQHVAFAGTDIARGETTLRAGQTLTSREIGILAAIGINTVEVFRRPRVAILSTGDEIIPPGTPPTPGSVYDSNAAIIAAAVRELGCEPVELGIVSDDREQLEQRLREGLHCDAVILSGGTSKGAGDLSYRVVSELSNPGIVAHGVALKPGKPICLAVEDGKPIVILPGFPTSAIFTFHEFVAPVLASLAGRSRDERATVTARLPIHVRSEIGRTEYLLVGLVNSDTGIAAYPIGKGSGSVTTFSHADGFLTIDQRTEYLEQDTPITVQLLSKEITPADFVAIGSHCTGLDFLIGELRRRGFSTKTLHVGSQGGLAAAKRGECDVAGIHLLDPDSGIYNRPFLDDALEFVPGYERQQGIIFRADDQRFSGHTISDATAAALADPDCTLINRNVGSGTRILIDRLLDGATPPGYLVQAKSHNAVAAAIEQGRADWGVAIDVVARQADLGFIPLQDEAYDFAVPRTRLNRPAVRVFQELLRDPRIRRTLTEMGFRPAPEP